MVQPLSMAYEQPFDQEQEQGGSSSSPDASPKDDKPGLKNLPGWQLHRANACGGRRLVGFERGFSAEYWLRTRQKDPLAMMTMRRVLVETGLSLPLNRWRDEDVVKQVAHLVKSGGWHVCEPVVKVYTVKTSPEPAFAPVPRRGPKSSQPPAVSEVPENNTLAGSADQDAIAAALTQAAESGVPLCEECAKLAAARAA
jgi:hypothetical protein